MNCAELELLICEYVDGTLAGSERARVELHLAECPACAELAQDSAAAVGFMAKAGAVEPPPELVTRLLFAVPARQAKGWRRWLGAVLNPILQPRFAMGMAMTILSFSLMAQFVAPIRQLRSSDLEPAKVWAGLEDRSTRAWARTVKFYDNLKFVYQIQTTLREWQQQQQEEAQTAPDRAPDQGKPPAAAQPDERKLPVKQPVAAPEPTR